MKHAAKIMLSLENTLILFTFFFFFLEDSILFLNFATDSVCPFVWVSGLFSGKGRLWNVNLQISNLANLTIIGRDMATRTPRRVYYILSYLNILLFYGNSMDVRGIL